MSWFRKEQGCIYISKQSIQDLQNDLMNSNRKINELSFLIEKLDGRLSSLQGRFYQHLQGKKDEEPEDSNTSFTPISI